MFVLKMLVGKQIVLLCREQDTVDMSCHNHVNDSGQVQGHGGILMSVPVT